MTLGILGKVHYKTPREVRFWEKDSGDRHSQGPISFGFFPDWEREQIQPLGYNQANSPSPCP